MPHKTSGIFWVPSEISGAYKAEPLFLDKVHHNIEHESIPVPNQAEGLFSDFRVFSIPGLSEWNFWRYLSGYKLWTVALMPEQMAGIVLLVVEPKYIYDTEQEPIKLIEDGIKFQRDVIKYYIKFAQFISVRLILLSLAYEPFHLSDEHLIGSIPPEVKVLKYNLQEDFDFVTDFKSVFGKYP